MEIEPGSTEGSRRSWVAVSFDLKVFLMNDFANSLISEFKSKFISNLFLVSVRAGQINNKC